MIFRQLFDSVSGTYSYLLASRAGGEALILDPVLEKVDRYCQLLRELDLRLVKAVDTHLHADHVTGLGELRDRTHCVTIMGEQSKADVVAMRVTEGDKVMIEGLSLDVMYTPGHTDDSYSYLMGDRVFTGDTLLIRGTGRTDFQNGSARAQYDSIFNRLLKLPDETMVFPAHDYKGDTVSTIGEERRFNPRLQVRSVDEYIELMGNLKLPNPKMMDVAVPANMHVGLHQDDLAKQGLSLTAREAIDSLGRPDILLVDLRENSERAKHGTLPGALHAPYPCDRRKPAARRHVARSGRSDRTSHRVLLRLRRTLGHGGRRRQGGGPCQHRAHRRRHGRLEEGRRTGADGVRVNAPCRRCKSLVIAGHDGYGCSAFHPLQLLHQHIQRVRQHHAAAFGQPFRNHDALCRRIEALERRDAAERPGRHPRRGRPPATPGENRALQVHDRLERGETRRSATPRSPAALNSPVSVSSELTRLSLPDTQPRRDSGSTR